MKENTTDFVIQINFLPFSSSSTGNSILFANLPRKDFWPSLWSEQQ